MGASHESHADLPPVPAERDITPAPEDFRDPPPLTRYLWPLLWFGVAALLVAVVRAGGWHDRSEGHGHGEGDGHGEVHAAPGHAEDGHGDAGHGDAGHGDAGHGDAGHGDAGHGDAEGR